MLTDLGADQVASDTQPGGNMEGKEARFGIATSTLWAAATTAASNGSVNSMHDSYTPLGVSSIANRDRAGHGFSEMLYALSSAGNNNGSAFAGISANTPFCNLSRLAAALLESPCSG